MRKLLTLVPLLALAGCASVSNPFSTAVPPQIQVAQVCKAYTLIYMEAAQYKPKMPATTVQMLLHSETIAEPLCHFGAALPNASTAELTIMQQALAQVTSAVAAAKAKP